MSLENYVTGLMKNPSPDLKGRLMLSLLDKLEKLYLSQVVKRREAEEKAAEDCGIPVISVGNVTAGGTGRPLYHQNGGHAGKGRLPSCHYQPGLPERS